MCRRRLESGLRLPSLYRTVLRSGPANLSQAPGKEKRAYTQKIHGRFQDQEPGSDASPPDTPSVFCAPSLLKRAGNLSTAQVRRTLTKVNPHKAAGSDTIPSQVITECAQQLANVLTDVFNNCLSQAVVPACFSTTTVAPVAVKSSMTCLNDSHPAAVIMKCFERPV